MYEKEQKEIEEYTVHEIEQGVHKEHMKSSAQQDGYWTDYMKFEYNEHTYSYIDKLAHYSFHFEFYFDQV